MSRRNGHERRASLTTNLSNARGKFYPRTPSLVYECKKNSEEVYERVDPTDTSNEQIAFDHAKLWVATRRSGWFKSAGNDHGPSNSMASKRRPGFSNLTWSRRLDTTGPFGILSPGLIQSTGLEDYGSKQSEQSYGGSSRTPSAFKYASADHPANRPGMIA